MSACPLSNPNKAVVQMAEERVLRDLVDPAVTDTDELLRRLSAENPQSNAFPGDQVRQGKAMLMSWRSQLQKAICGNDRIASHPAVAGTDNVNDMVALAALVAAEVPTAIGSGINNMLIAALVVRIGIRKFCDGYEPTEA